MFTTDDAATALRVSCPHVIVRKPDPEVVPMERIREEPLRVLHLFAQVHTMGLMDPDGGCGLEQTFGIGTGVCRSCPEFADTRYCIQCGFGPVTREVAAIIEGKWRDAAMKRPAVIRHIERLEALAKHLSTLGRTFYWRTSVHSHLSPEDLESIIGNPEQIGYVQEAEKTE